MKIKLGNINRSAPMTLICLLASRSENRKNINRKLLMLTRNLTKGCIWILGVIIPTLSVGQANTTLFSKLDPQYSNVYFNNKLTDTKEANIMVYSNFYGGAGVGIGDINNDGLQDIYFAGNQVGDKLYLNKGKLVFEDITEKAGIIDNGGWSSGVLFGDVNGDGLQDIYVTRELYDDNPELRKNKLYINNGDNTFSEQSAQYGLDDSERTRHATFIDFDKDGDLDVFLLNQPPNPGNYSPYHQAQLLLPEYSPRLMENQGTTFVDVTEKSGMLVPCFPNSVTASDLNNDGWTDLYIANDYWVRDFIYMNNGDGTFTDRTFEMTRHISFSSMGIDAGDINNDGWLDVFVLDMVAEDNYRRKSNMSGMPKNAFMKVVKEKGHNQYMFNMLHLNNGEGLFSDIAQLCNVGATDWSWSVLLADFDNDGLKDISIVNGLMRDIRDNDAAREFPKYIESSVQEFVRKNPDAGDVSLWDVVDFEEAMNISPSVKLQNYAFKNTGNFTFEKVSNEWGLVENSFSNGSAYADLDNDGDLELVVNNINDIAFIYENNAEKRPDNHFLRIIPIVDEKGKTVLNTKVWIETDGEKQYDEITSVRGMYSTSEHIAHFGLGEKDKVDKVVVEWPDGKRNILKNQKTNRIIEVKYSDAQFEKIVESPLKNPQFVNATNQIGLVIKHNENVFDDFEKQLMLPHKFSDRGPGFAIGDVNGDGLDDIFMGGSAGIEGRLFNQNPDGSFGVLPFPDLKNDKNSEDIDALFFDVEGDGDLDLYVVSGGNEYRAGSNAYQDRLYLNDGKATFTKSESSLPKLTFSGSKVVPADYDQDGDIDLFIGGMHTPWEYPTPTTSTLLRNDAGKFTDVTGKIASDLQKIGMVNDAAWVDYDGDGMLDLVIVGEWMPLTIFKNIDGKFKNSTKELGLENTTGWWFGIDVADMDKDGDMDFILGNLGLNYEYKASEEKPVHVFYYDFDNNGSGDLVLAQYEGDKLIPIRERKRSVEQVPLLEEKINTFDAFAKADVYEIYGNDNLRNALHYEAKTFASVYAENLGNGKFEFHQLPIEAQFSPINDMIIDDFNNDGNLDIFAAGNLYGTEVETVRADAGIGLLLAGDGKGNFTFVNHEESGILLPYDVKRLKPFHYQQSKIIIAGCNNDFYQFFKKNE